MSEVTLESLAERITVLEREVAVLKGGGVDPPGTVGDEQSDDPRAVARWIATFDAIPALRMSAAEEAAWRAARAEQGRSDAARIERLAADFPGAAG
ncbi:MAG: hypothetical protein J0I06_10445 [Planctomycetes bacterium]|nr:hypothetical protein [Planctomycetota bacterium]